MAVEHILRKMSNMTNDDETNNPMRKIRILKNRDGHTRQDFVDDECVYEEKIVSNQNKIDIQKELYEHKLDTISADLKEDDDIPTSVTDFLSKMGENELPEGWQDSPIARRAYSMGFAEGSDAVMGMHFKSLRTLAHILDLELKKDFSL